MKNPPILYAWQLQPGDTKTVRSALASAKIKKGDYFVHRLIANGRIYVVTKVGLVRKNGTQRIELKACTK